MEPLLPVRPKHPLGCYHPRVPDRAAMDAVFFVLGTGETLADTGYTQQAEIFDLVTGWTGDEALDPDADRVEQHLRGHEQLVDRGARGRPVHAKVELAEEQLVAEDPAAAVEDRLASDDDLDALCAGGRLLDRCPGTALDAHRASGCRNASAIPCLRRQPDRPIIWRGATATSPSVGCGVKSSGTSRS